MSNDPRISWELPSPHGILIDEAQAAWWSGHVEDILELDGGDGGLLVASQTGGVWIVTDGNPALALSNDWDAPDVNTLAAGPDGPRHFFAGGGKTIEKNLLDDPPTPPTQEGFIYETDASDPLPLLAWRPVNAPLPRSSGKVNSLLVLRRHRIILAACDHGLYWSAIPASEAQRGCLDPRRLSASPRQPFKWTRAYEVDVGQGGYFSVVAGSLSEGTRTPSGRDLSYISVGEGVAGEEDLGNVSIVAGGKAAGVFVGRWQTGNILTGKPDNFRLERASFIDPEVGDVTGLMFRDTGATSVAVCQLFPKKLYAACSEPDGRFKAVIRSRDGGRRWEATGFKLEGVARGKDVRGVAGDQGNGWNNCIGVMPAGPELVAFGWVPGVFLSRDGGRNWRLIEGGPHLHADVNVVRFKPTVNKKHYLYVGSDGGVARVDLDEFVEKGKVVARSDYNRLLPTIQCYSTFPVPRNFSGTLAASRAAPGWVSTGTQDNGNIYCHLAAGAPWLMLDGGDGGWNAFLEDGALVRNVLNDYVTAAFLQAGAITGTDTIPVTVPPDGDPRGLKSPAADIVRRPRFRNSNGLLMSAVAGVGPNVYGLFTDAPNHYNWELLGTLPPGLTVTTLTSHTGGTVFVGATTGRIFALDSRQGTFLELGVALPKPTPSMPQKGGLFCRIVTLSETSAFATLNGTDQKNSYVLRLDGLKWTLPLCAGLPTGEFFYGIEGVMQEGRQIVFAATDERVYMSEDAGDHWVPASANLPRRAHCADLRVALRGDRQEEWLYLSTYGRSVWRARLFNVHHG